MMQCLLVVLLALGLLREPYAVPMILDAFTVSGLELTNSAIEIICEQTDSFHY